MFEKTRREAAAAAVLVAGLVAADPCGARAETAASITSPQNVPEVVALIPKPMQMERMPGEFPLTAGTRILVPPQNGEVRRIGEFLRDSLTTVTAAPLAIAEAPAGSLPVDSIVLTTAGVSTELGEEGYELSITGEGVSLRASTARGLFYGVQTLRQLLPAEKDTSGTLPALQITDRPRYPWRGFMLDCSRHFMDKAFVKRTLDLMALHKMNVFHWHFIDNNGWRMEVESYPKLIEVAAWRGPKDDQYGGYYTKDDIREIVDYAGKLFINVVPEFEMPGHSDAALSAYPELTCTGQAPKYPDGPLPNEHLKWFSEDLGIRPFCAGKDEVFKFHEAIFNEAVELFPSPVFHVGGDERPTGIWEKCPHCQARMKAEGLKDEHDLQNWFMRRISDMLEKKGKRVITWAVTRSDPYKPTDMDDLGNNAMIQNWHDGASFAARQGWDTVNSNNIFVYFDYPEVEGQNKPDWMPMLKLDKVYSFNPTPTDLSTTEAAHIVGSEACLWTELIPQENVDPYIFPRLLAVAETVWTPQKERDFADFQKRLAPHRARLEKMGVRFRETQVTK